MHNPRRQPGESIREMRDEKVLLPVVTLVAFALGSVSTAAGAWLSSRVSDHWPWYTIGISLALCGIAAWWYITAPKKAVSWNRGLRAERAVADALSELGAHGYQVFHDLPDTTSSGERCNIDHVLAGPEGVFIVETKFRSKTGHGPHRVKVTPEAVLVDGRPVEPDPRAQARACADSVRHRLTARLGWQPHVQAVVVLPSWFTESGFGDGAWVLNERALVNSLKKVRCEHLTGPPLNQVVAELDTWSRQPVR